MQKSKKIKFILATIFILIIVFGLAKTNIAQAWVVKSATATAFIFILSGVLSFVIDLLNIAATIFNWVVSPDIILNTLTNPAIYKTWGIVRDILNVSFIMFLLFSAFATVFQIEKYSYKKTLLMIVLMALLVNFSFPISRFIIDFANMLMYYFIDALDLGKNTIKGDWLVTSARSGNLEEVLLAKSSDSIPALISATVFTFILAITLLIIAVLFLIRIIALSILIIFSPLAFVGSAIPPLSKYSNDWWSKLFSYAFFGPIMIFMLYIAVEMMGLMQVEKIPLIEIASSNSTKPSLIAAYASLATPIVILWMGLGIAQSMSIAGASSVVGFGQKFMKGAGKWTATAPWRATKGTAKGISKWSGATGAVQQKLSSVKDDWKSARESREAKGAAFLRVKGAEEKDMRRRAEEHKKNFTTDDELEKLAENGDAAAAYRLAEDKKIKQETYDKFVANAKDKTGSLTKSINDKVKQNRADLVTTNKIATMTPEEIKKAKEEAKSKKIAGAGAWGTDQVKDYVAKQEMGKLNAEKYSEQDWAGITKDLIDPKTGSVNPDKARIIKAAAWAFTELSGEAKSEVRKRMSAANRMALINAGNSLTPPVQIPL